MHYNISFACVSHPGKYRKENQDNYICNGVYMGKQKATQELPLTGCAPSSAYPLFGIFDGLGGEAYGEVASYIAAQLASKTCISHNAAADITRYCLDANSSICHYALENDIAAMGTTAALLAFTPDNIVLCNIGDSKVFRLSEQTMKQLSEDHVLFSSFGAKAPLSQYLGIPADELLIEPYTTCLPYRHQDIYLLCSDGLTDMVGIDEIESILLHTTLQESAEKLLHQALANGGKDNVSLIVCKVEQQGIM